MLETEQKKNAYLKNKAKAADDKEDEIRNLHRELSELQVNINIHVYITKPQHNLNNFNVVSYLLQSYFFEYRYANLRMIQLLCKGNIFA